MRNREYVCYRGGRMPSATTRRRIRAAMKKFEHAYLEWLKDPLREKSEKPNPREFGLKPNQVETLVRHCEGVARRHGDLTVSE